MLKTMLLKSLALCALAIGFLVNSGAYAADATVTGYWFQKGSSYRYKFETNFELKESVDGYLLWTLLASPTEMQKIGKQGKEYVRGSFNPETRQLLLTGYRKEDPHTILGLDEYRLQVSKDGKYIYGVTKGNGDWIGRFDSRPSEISALEQTRKVAETEEMKRTTIAQRNKEVKVPVMGRPDCFLFYPFRPVPPNLTVKWAGSCENGFVRAYQYGSPENIEFYSGDQRVSNAGIDTNFGGMAGFPCGSGTGRTDFLWNFSDGEVWQGNFCEWKKIRETDVIEKALTEQREQAERKAQQIREIAISRLISTGAQAVYLEAGKAQRNGSVSYNGQTFYGPELYELIINKFPKSDYAVKASDQLSALKHQSDADSSARQRQNDAQRASDDASRKERSQCSVRISRCEDSCGSGANRKYCVSACASLCNQF